MADDSTNEEVGSTIEDVVSTIELEALSVGKEECGSSTPVKTLRLAVNFFTNALIFVTVFTCLVYACRPKLTIYKLHIILCVLGYQFFMCQAVMAISQYNSCTVHLQKRHRVHVHWVLQFLGVALVTAGSVLYMLTLDSHFTSPHGALGIVAVAASLFSFLNGIIAFAVSKCCSNVKVKLGFRIFHIITGVLTLALAAACLGFGIENPDFKFWLSSWFNNDDIPAPVLQLMIGLFTFLVILDAVIPQKAQ